MLRDYQARAIDQLYQWFRAYKTGNPCLVLPTGAGKSWIIAALVKDAITSWPDTRVLVLSHVAELLEQDAEKMRALWPNAPMGMYAASLRSKQAGEPITFGSIQSLRGKAWMLGHVDLVLVDEAHLINTKAEGSYRELLAELEQINPRVRVVGLTATPYRLGQGLITDGDHALFRHLIEPVTIEELVYKGYLAPLHSKPTETKLDTGGVGKRGGEWVEKDLAEAVDREVTNQEAVAEIVRRGQDRRHWLIFCTGVDHAHHIQAELQAQGIEAGCITGKTPKGERAQLIADFKAGKIRALTNANVLTTGFDHPDTDLIAMLRPTLSPALYVQMAGRGLRPKAHTDHCLVLDFAGNVSDHGPITAVEPPKRGGDGDGETPVKPCPECDELVHLSAKVCPDCGHEFEEQEKEQAWRLASEDIMGIDGDEMGVTSWVWRKHVSKSSGKEMIKVSYYGRNLSDKPVTEYLTLLHDGYAGHKALRTLGSIASQAGVDISSGGDLDSLCETMNAAPHPAVIGYRKEGKFMRVTKREWS